MISSKFAAFLHYTFSEQDLWMAASEHLHYNKKHTVSCFLSLPTVIIHQFHSYTKILTIIPFIPTPSFPYSRPESPHLLHFHPDSYHPHPDLRIPTLIPRIPTLILRVPNLILRISTQPDSHHSHPDSTHSHHSPHSVPWFPILASTDSRITKGKMDGYLNFLLIFHEHVQ